MLNEGHPTADGADSYHVTSSPPPTHGPDPGRVAVIERASQLSGVVAAVLGAVVLIGWALDAEIMTVVAPGIGTVKVTTAISFVLTGTALWFIRRRGLSMGLAALVVVIATVTSFEYALDLDLGFSQAPLPGFELIGPSGLMAPSTAMAFLLAGCALVALLLHRTRIAHALAVVLFVTSFLAFLGYLFNVNSLDELALYTTMPLHASLGLIVVAGGILAANPREGLTLIFANHGAGGLMVRRVLPLAIGVPVIAAWLVILGLEEGVYDDHFAVALVAVATVLLLGLLIAWTAEQMFALDTKRREATQREVEASAAALRQEELNRIKTEFVSAVAHDLKAPMTVISGFAELLGDEVDEEERRVLAEQVVGGVTRLSRLVDDLLEVGRIQSGTLTFAAEPFDLDRVVRGAASEIYAMDPGRPVEVRPDAELPQAIGDEERTWRVLINLLSNAFKFSPDGSPVEVTVERCGDEIEVTVRDHGPGIAPEDIPKLFLQFSRLESSQRQKVKGTGLGLYIVKSLVEGQGGRVGVESTPGDGARFSFTLPAQTADVGATAN